MMFIENGIAREATAEEVMAMRAYDEQQSEQPAEPTPEERMEARIEMIEECLLEMSELIYV